MKILFSDDVLEKNCLSNMMTLMCDGVGFVFSSVIIGSSSWKGKRYYCWRKHKGLYSSKKFLKSSLFDSSTPVSPGAALFRYDDISDGLDERISSPTYLDFDSHGAGPDLLLYLISADRYPLVGFVTDTLVFFRVHEGSITIGDNEGKLRLRYLQAKIYFCTTRGYTVWEWMLTLREWLRQMNKTREFISPFVVRRLFVNDSVRN